MSILSKKKIIQLKNQNWREFFEGESKIHSVLLFWDSTRTTSFAHPCCIILFFISFFAIPLMEVISFRLLLLRMTPHPDVFFMRRAPSSAKKRDITSLWLFCSQMMRFWIGKFSLEFLEKFNVLTLNGLVCFSIRRIRASAV